MPVPKNPLRPEFYVYALHVGGATFYVGHGHSSRASDRVRYVKSLMKKKSGKPVKWVLSNLVVAKLVKRGYDVQIKYRRKNLTLERAKVLELQTIRKLLFSGIILANRQYNPGGPSSADVVVNSVLASSRKKSRA